MKTSRSHLLLAAAALMLAFGSAGCRDRDQTQNTGNSTSAGQQGTTTSPSTTTPSTGTTGAGTGTTTPPPNSTTPQTNPPPPSGTNP